MIDKIKELNIRIARYKKYYMDTDTDKIPFSHKMEYTKILTEKAKSMSAILDERKIKYSFFMSDLSRLVERYFKSLKMDFKFIMEDYEPSTDADYAILAGNENTLIEIKDKSSLIELEKLKVVGDSRVKVILRKCEGDSKVAYNSHHSDTWEGFIIKTYEKYHLVEFKGNDYHFTRCVPKYWQKSLGRNILCFDLPTGEKLKNAFYKELK